MSVIENIKNFFADDRTSTMNTGEERFSLLRAPVADRLGYDDFVYPYSPMQRSKRYPKIINAYALESRANGDLAIMRNHRDHLEDLDSEIDRLDTRIDNIQTSEEVWNLYEKKRIGSFDGHPLYRSLFDCNFTAQKDVWQAIGPVIPNFRGDYIYPVRAFGVCEDIHRVYQFQACRFENTIQGMMIYVHTGTAQSGVVKYVGVEYYQVL